jgi:thioredoxin-like negative regulator of GroEL
MGQESGTGMPASGRDAATAVAAMLEAGRFDDAAQLLDSAIKRWPANTKLQLLKGTVLAKIRGEAQAALYFAGLLENPGTAMWAAKRLAALIRKNAVSPDVAVETARLIADSSIDKSLKNQMLHKVFEQSAAEQRDAMREYLSSCGIFK